MNNTNRFSIKRLTLLVVRNIVLNSKYLLGFLAAPIAAITTMSLLNTWTSGGYFDTIHFTMQSQAFLLTFGIIITATAFKELHSKKRGWFYLMLPANPLEKLLSHWLITSIGYAVVASISYVLASIVASSLNWMLFGSKFFILNPFTPQFLELLLHYCIIQSLFFFGAIYFKRNSLIKTLLSVFLIAIILIIIMAITIKFLYFDGSITASMIDSENVHLIYNRNIEMVLKVMYYALMAPFFLTASYFRLIEKEV